MLQGKRDSDIAKLVFQRNHVKLSTVAKKIRNYMDDKMMPLVDSHPYDATKPSLFTSISQEEQRRGSNRYVSPFRSNKLSLKASGLGNRNFSNVKTNNKLSLPGLVKSQ
jgi:hypothetical protein